MKSIRKKKLEQLQGQLPKGVLRLDEQTLLSHSGDKWFASNPPEAVAFPKNAKTVSEILRYANKHNIPLTARGAGYGYVGSCVPARGGIALSLKKINRIKEVNDKNFVAVVQPGVVTAQLQSKVEAKGLYYPPDPASRNDCTIGGNIATNAGGPRCLKYGVTRDYVIGLEVVLPNGAIARLGGSCHKNKTGFDLARFFVGSEGMLGIVTEATLKLLPMPPFKGCLSVGFRSMRHAAKVIQKIFKSGFLPSALEVADAFTLDAARERTNSRMFDGCNAHIIVEIDGQEKSVRSELRDLKKIIEKFSPLFIRKGLGDLGVEKFWALRREFSYSLRDTGLTKLNNDIAVPRGMLEPLFEFTGRLQKKHGIQVACFGHAGDGNIHVNLMMNENDPEQVKRSDVALDDLFKQVLAWGGVVTGEHGIGLARLPWWNQATSLEVRNLHAAFKKAVDPKGILNPGKFV
ncbi:MAG: FAD-linked oxidase C-terminal domain-containing protein [Verrucomicrobiota bacterium]|jgi:glycolate oxidase|nr:FAD-linked oxidase C-terminal domain-containing protein [Verrucomicrobiota bacterium]MEE2614203.1 FAD-linked oxidase C-terminal domain-containing protein [Verrucomicrobiota bacterium]